MFLNKVMELNPSLVDAAIFFHKKGELLPDTYVIDMDRLALNAENLKKTADAESVSLYFMLKQVGHNPVIARLLTDMGYAGAVAVDYREALEYVDQGIPLGNVGHLVQTPKATLPKILSARPEIMTIYSLEKAQEIEHICSHLHMEQQVMLRVMDNGDICLPGQTGGFSLASLPEVVSSLRKLPHVHIAGVTAFPCFLYDEKRGTIFPTHNSSTVVKAAAWLRDRGIPVSQVNLPSATCSDTIPLIHQIGGTHGEPGHGLTGTTPLHAEKNCAEIPGIVYVSEVSHTEGGMSFCYGGGHYRRSHMRLALVGDTRESRVVPVRPPAEENIDYYFTLEGLHPVSESVIMSFRTQMFVTRSSVALMTGLSQGMPRISGIFTSSGQKIRGRE
ncbi:alanine racemase [Parasphaerochaeta coccoides]|uniref:Alanine racemase domain protein n=1 Tax=Parasphaerochaeta coccoides (strain ATCC BAA-1237 / DSM 17374 / SPN1) TaxID=760011 RepID=F4GIU6_PARC1|nr:alanine racemase [Parasphaerochaeta coccoides]AEC02714.1 alanine racemase domain protein [Parasphaerochaeta coccoides DSM 17374]